MASFSGNPQDLFVSWEVGCFALGDYFLCAVEGYVLWIRRNHCISPFPANLFKQKEAATAVLFWEPSSPKLFSLGILSFDGADRFMYRLLDLGLH